jgi:hypothetical protein
MAIECYNTLCPRHSIHRFSDNEECDGPFCYENECIFEETLNINLIEEV